MDDELDNLDRRILHLLQVDARKPDTDIADATDVTARCFHCLPVAERTSVPR
jgi:DNA-binding Lrp family transcriptional regulator